MRHPDGMQHRQIRYSNPVNVLKNLKVLLQLELGSVSLSRYHVPPTVMVGLRRGLLPIQRGESPLHIEFEALPGSLWLDSDAVHGGSVDHSAIDRFSDDRNDLAGACRYFCADVSSGLPVGCDTERGA